MAVSEPRKLGLGAFMRPVSIHTAWWRFPGACPDAHGERYRKAREVYDVATGPWHSPADDVFVRDVGNGIYLDPERIQRLGATKPDNRPRSSVCTRPAPSERPESMSGIPENIDRHAA